MKKLIIVTIVFFVILSFIFAIRSIDAPDQRESTLDNDVYGDNGENPFDDESDNPEEKEEGETIELEVVD
ncbi:MAG: hypothetical protein ACOCV3_06535 [Halanaerobiales bacterium]